MKWSRVWRNQGRDWDGGGGLKWGRVWEELGIREGVGGGGVEVG